MRPLYLSLCFSVFLSAAHAQAPVWQGGAQTTHPAPGDDTGAQGHSVATDNAGNTYVGGALTTGSGGTPASRAFGNTIVSSTGQRSGFVAKLSAARQWEWAVRVSSNGTGATVDQVVTDAAGNVYLAGVADGTIVTVGTSRYVSPQAGLFLARLNPAGQVQWVIGADMPAGGRVALTGMGLDPQTGNLALGGTYGREQLRFGGTTLPLPFQQQAEGALFVARAHGGGSWLSALAVVPAGTDSNTYLSVQDAAVGPQGEVAVGGALRGTAAFGINTLTIPAGSPASSRFFVALLTPANTWEWAISSSAASGGRVRSVAFDRPGNVWATGTLDGPAQLDGTPLPAGAASFVSRITPAGLWGPAAGTTASTTGLVADAAGNGIVVGDLTSGATSAATYSFGSLSFAATGNRSFVARVTPAGQWQYALPAPAIGAGTTVASQYFFRKPALGSSGEAYLTGDFRGGPLLLGNSSLTASSYAASSPLGGDVLLARLAQAGAVLGTRQAQHGALTAFPNPVTGPLITLRLPAPAPTVLPVTLYDSTGRAIRQGSVAAGQPEATLSTAGLPAGLYLLRCGSSLCQLQIE
ncbi:T9SS type A sorting domain-containing protein [Hymenobacter saemangeumensis]